MERGYTLAALLTLLAVMAIFLALALPLWSRVKQRSNEEELIFRGKEYMEAFGRYHQRFNSFPPDLETLYKSKMIRRLYPDPMTKSGKWKLIHPGEALITGQAGQTGGTQGIPTGGQLGTGTGTPGTQNREGGADGEQDDGEGGGQQAGGGGSGGEEEEEHKDGEEEEVETIGPVMGVVSRSRKSSIRTYMGADRYNKWYFIYGMNANPAKGGVQPAPPPK